MRHRPDSVTLLHSVRCRGERGFVSPAPHHGQPMQHREPQLFLHDGDTVTVEIDGVGSITNRVSAEIIQRG
ncbi:fumarylacetoacetate hydrolase family protein [Pseudonocardia nigra]|uniref:fumarylacetoacetate hydrolase family protein n=1 Tax=Pseudonocardia nigra TaxID=1921578 RepID=UPI001C5CE5CD|nr:fumarylacetoacetate hydrolase family protein [Pseudonocardia nigra]